MMKRVIKFFFLGFTLCFSAVFIALVLIHEVRFAALIACIIGFIGALFSVGFMKRVLKRVSFEINSTNKDNQKGLAWYEERVREQITDLHFLPSAKTDGIEFFKPRGLYKVFEPEIELEVTPYYIRIKASRLMIRLISTYVEIENEENEK